MTAGEIDIDHLRGWVGRQQEVEHTLDLFPARALSGLFDRDETLQAGDPLPLPWHWLYFLETPRRSAIDVDGHPLRGGFLPPVPLPRRMWAAGGMKVDEPLLLDERTRKISSIRGVDLKQGRSGPLLFVSVEHAYWQRDRCCLVETQNLAYREAATVAVALPAGSPTARAAAWSRVIRPDASLLFLFSALTYNGHRIHYDSDYATQQEFYPALVVQGPLLAALLLDLLRTELPSARVTQFHFRADRPSFVDAPIRFCGAVDGHAVTLWTSDSNGVAGMSASAVIA